jgi:hypothetical protein
VGVPYKPGNSKNDQKCEKNPGWPTNHLEV